MSFTSKLLYTIGSALLLNSGYSSYEHRQLSKQLGASAPPLPIDVKLESLVACVLFLIGALVSIYPEQKHVKDIVTQEVVEGYTEPVLGPIDMGKATVKSQAMGTGDYDQIENRVGYIDIRRRRKEYQKWKQATSEKKE